MVLRRPLGRRGRRLADEAGFVGANRDNRPGSIVLEFEPRVAADLRSAAGQTLAVGALAAGGLLLVALALFRWILHREGLERRLEHERRLASLGEMSAVLAHEIRNPLASLKGNAQLLARAAARGRASTRAKAERVVDEAVRLETLTNDLLEFVRTGAIQPRADRSGRARARGRRPRSATARVDGRRRPARRATLVARPRRACARCWST